MRILAVETSCDETAIAIAEFSPHLLSAEKISCKAQSTKGAGFSGSKKLPQIRVLSNIVSSQIKLHAKYGGVVPNLAKREHQKNLVPLLLASLKEAGLRKSNVKGQKSKVQLKTQNELDKILEREQGLLTHFKKHVLPLKPPPIDMIAVTYGPGLAPALWVGVNFAKALAYLWGKPLIPVNHMAGHLYSALLQKDDTLHVIQFPALALLVSGGHTELVLVRGHGKFKILGETLDDAAGEAFDKVARILGLGYPGGPEVSKEAERNWKREAGSGKLALPRPMINSKDYNFSFSGLKTAALYLTRDLGVKKTRQLRPLIAKEFQDAVVEVLVKKTVRAAKEYKVRTVLLGGGVAANKLLRQELNNKLRSGLPEADCWMPEAALAGDNALMIAVAAYFLGKKKARNRVHADANARLGK